MSAQVRMTVDMLETALLGRDFAGRAVRRVDRRALLAVGARFDELAKVPECADLVARVLAFDDPRGLAVTARSRMVRAASRRLLGPWFGSVSAAFQFRATVAACWPQLTPYEIGAANWVLDPALESLADRIEQSRQGVSMRGIRW